MDVALEDSISGTEWIPILRSLIYESGRFRDFYSLRVLRSSK